MTSCILDMLKIQNSVMFFTDLVVVREIGKKSFFDLQGEKAIPALIRKSTKDRMGIGARSVLNLALGVQAINTAVHIKDLKCLKKNFFIVREIEC